jgi:hypothetical protein
MLLHWREEYELMIEQLLNLNSSIQKESFFFKENSFHLLDKDIQMHQDVVEKIKMLLDSIFL